LKNMKVNGKDDIPYIMEHKKCLKPPTSHSRHSRHSRHGDLAGSDVSFVNNK